MKPLPTNPNIDQLKRQAKDLLNAVRRHNADAMARFRTSLPEAAGKSAEYLAQLRLHDAQSCVARDYGFASWAALRDFVELSRARLSNPAELAANFARLAYAGDVAGGMDRSKPDQAVRYLALLLEQGPLDPWIACAAGEISIIQRQLVNDPAWIAKAGGPLNLPPLVAATHSGLIQLPEHRTGIHGTVGFLLEAGADPNQSVASRWPPASLSEPSRDHRLSALYGAAGVNHNADVTRLLLDTGAAPNDQESLYHALESTDATIVRLLLDAGAIVSGTNALYHALDYDKLDTFQLLLSRTETLNDQDMGPLLLWAIRRRRSVAHIESIIGAGADPAAKAKDGTSAFILALRQGLPELAALLKRADVAEEPSEADLFVAACATANAEEARRLQTRNPDFPYVFEDAQLSMFSDLAAEGCNEAVKLMAELGWPIDVRGGDWDASALNQAVFRGDAALAETLLSHGARWTEQHGYGDNVCGTLSWASLNQPKPEGDWVACAKVLVTYGMPGAARNPEDPKTVLIDGQPCRFSEEVTDYLLSVGDM